jgi:OmpA family
VGTAKKKLRVRVLLARSPDLAFCSSLSPGAQHFAFVVQCSSEETGMRLWLRAWFAIVLGVIGPVPVSANQDFIVFFPGPNPERLDPEQWRVTAEGEAVVNEAAAAHKEWGGYILLAGHDQRVGAEADALARSEKRAAAVRELLVRRGVSPHAIRIKACGFANPIVETVPGVKEPQNRFVIFWWADTLANLEVAERDACVPRGERKN